MRCPNCTSLDTQVKDSRPTEDSAAIRRRRLCLACGFRDFAGEALGPQVDQHEMGVGTAGNDVEAF